MPFVVTTMKKDIHPKVNMETKVKCACGSTFVTISTLPSIQVDICSSCHPLFTGTQKFVDTEGRIDKFNKKIKNIEVKKKKHEEVSKSKKVKQTIVKDAPQGSLKDILKQLREEEKQSETPVSE